MSAAKLQATDRVTLTAKGWAFLERRRAKRASKAKGVRRG